VAYFCFTVLYSPPYPVLTCPSPISHEEGPLLPVYTFTPAAPEEALWAKMCAFIHLFILQRICCHFTFKWVMKKGCCL
jgi:hypothetical protein